jgi:hypothetical protein
MFPGLDGMAVTKTARSPGYSRKPQFSTAEFRISRKAGFEKAPSATASDRVMNTFMRSAPTIRFKAIAGAATLLTVFAPSVQGIDIQFDFSFDTNNFFTGNLQRQNVLNAAAAVFESRLTDQLTAITPGGSNTWTATFTHPGTGLSQQVLNPTIPQNVIRVYAGGQDLPSDTLGLGGPGGYSVSGSTTFVQTVSLRGQLGAAVEPQTDFGPWGGSITFDTLASWYFDQDVTTMENIGLMSDFYSVAVHELAHLLGFGTADSWGTWRVGSSFTGPASMALNGGVAVPLDGDGSHWAEGVTSDVLSPIFVDNQETAMDPTIFDGTRKYFTELDFAGLDDVGWQVIPEPATALLVWAGAAILAFGRKRATARLG